MNVLDLVRPDLRDFTLYTPASSDDRAVRLHANELPFRGADDATARGLHRYPPPRDGALRHALAALYGVEATQLLVTRGSDDAIDLLVRTFCRAGRDRVLTTRPGFAMYGAFARLQGCAVDHVVLRSDADYALEPGALLEAAGPDTRLVFVCTPHNPSGTVTPPQVIETLCRALDGRALVIVDEAYAEFSGTPSATTLIERCDNVAVLRTMSKAFGLAGARVGAVLGGAPLIATLDRLLTPYPLPTHSVEAALAALAPAALAMRRAQWRGIVDERQRLAGALAALPCVTRVHPSDANFVLTRMTDARARVALCRERGFLVRRVDLGDGDGVRITVGTPEQNDGLLAALGADA